MDINNLSFNSENFSLLSAADFFQAGGVVSCEGGGAGRPRET